MRWVGVFASRRSLAAAGLAFALWTIPIAAGAAFSSSTSGTMQFQSNTLASPTGFTGTCANNNHYIYLSWTATTSSYATGYNLAWTAPYGPNGSTVVFAGSTSSTMITGQSNTLFTLTLTTFYRSWTSTAATTTVQC